MASSEGAKNQMRLEIFFLEPVANPAKGGMQTLLFYGTGQYLCYQVENERLMRIQEGEMLLTGKEAIKLSFINPSSGKKAIFATIVNLNKIFIIMNKAELIDQITSDAGLTKTQAGKVVDAFSSAVIITLKKGDKITLPRFGTFSVSKRAARTGRNPQTGEAIKIKASKVARFKPGKEFAEKIQGGKAKG